MDTTTSRAEYQRAWRAKNRDSVNEKKRAWRAKNRDKVNADTQAWIDQNRDKVNAQKKAWRSANPDKLASEYAANANRMRITRPLQRKFLNALKAYYGCTSPDCKWDGQFSPCQLDFHHVDPSTKRFAISQRCHFGPALYEEINKCCVLCSNCHRSATAHGFDSTQVTKCNLDDQGRVIGPV